MIDVRSKYLRLALGFCMFLLHCESNDVGEKEPEKVKTAPTVVTLESQKTTLRVLNPKHHKCYLSHVTKQGAVQVAKINDKLDVHTFIVPSGIYVITDKDASVSYAAPALAELITDQPIEIKIGGGNLSTKQWAWIPGGHALIGDTIGVGARDEPLSLQTIPAFWMARTVVTNQQYAEFLKASGEYDEDWIDLRSRKCLIKTNPVDKFVVYKQDQTKPVVMVSLAGAKAYCQWLTQTEGRIHRLPTEFEWEKAAKGPSSFVYSYGNIYNQFLANQESGLIAPVAKFNQNEYGLYDMTGNVFEWMSNQYDPTKPDKVMNQSLRGGSFVLDGIYQRNSFRMRQSKTVMTDDIGFRVLREATKTESEQ